MECLHNRVPFNVNINVVINSSIFFFSHFHIAYLCRAVCVKTFLLYFALDKSFASLISVVLTEQSLPDDLSIVLLHS